MDRGTIDRTYEEEIIGFAVNDINSYDHIVDDWADGTLEFKLNFVFAQSNGNISSSSKGFSVSLDDMFTIENDVVTGPKGYLFGGDNQAPVPVVAWDLNKYGDTWQVVVTEFDPGTERTYTTSVASNFGSNFSSGDEKTGIKFGSTQTTTITNSYSFEITGTSDLLDEDIIDYCQKELLGYYTLPGSTVPFLAASERNNTGMVSVIMQPRK